MIERIFPQGGFIPFREQVKLEIVLSALLAYQISQLVELVSHCTFLSLALLCAGFGGGLLSFGFLYFYAF